MGEAIQFSVAFVLVTPEGSSDGPGDFQTCLSLWRIRAECQHRDHGTELGQNEAQYALVVLAQGTCATAWERQKSLLAVIASDIAWGTRGVGRAGSHLTV